MNPFLLVYEGFHKFSCLWLCSEVAFLTKLKLESARSRHGVINSRGLEFMVNILHVADYITYE